MNLLQQSQPTSGQHYSGGNRVPDVNQFLNKLDTKKNARDAKVDAGAGHGESDKQQADKMRHRRYNTRVVYDPVTRKNVEISDADMEYEKSANNPMISVPNENLGKPTTVPVSSTMSGETYRRAQDITAPPQPIAAGSASDVPIQSEKTSILFYKTPSVSFEPMYAILEQRANVLCTGIFFSIVIVGRGFGGSLWGLIPLAVCVACGVFLWAKDLIKQGRDLEWSSEQERGETATANLIPESVEWINAALNLLWGMLNPEMFASVADTLEDVMAASVPGIIENVRVADISQGNNPIRILNMRSLPDSHVEDIKEEIHEINAKKMDPDELAATEQAGEFYNLEVSIAYHAKPSGTDVTSTAKNMGMHLVFYLGVKGLFGIPLHIWGELLGLVATARIRLQLVPEPPYIKALTFTLMGKPKIHAGCTPMFQKGVNILNLPLISNFVNWAVGTAAAMYVAPKSMTLDISKLIQGDDIKKEVYGLGVIFIRIHKATNLSKQDLRGSKGGGSDPYITVSWSKFSKPQFCTRVIEDDLNPIFEESCGILVTADVIKADEQVSLELWDSDRSSADDVVGKVELSIQKLVQHPGEMFPQVSKLRGVKAESAMPGELHWEVGFFGRTQFRTALRTDGEDANLPKALHGKKELQDDKGSIDTAVEDAVIHTPPDLLWPSGILSIVVHQIVGLEYANVQGTTGKRRGREFEPARPEAGETKGEVAKKLPSSYCTMLLNDELIYKTRTKITSSQPIFNAGTERFIRDWRSCLVTISVRDARYRQHDSLIGVVPLKVTDVLSKGSQVTRWYSIAGGIGFGRIRISLLFRSVELTLSPSQLGWEVGTFEFLSDTITAVGCGNDAKTSMRLRTGGSSAVIKKTACSMLEDGTGLRWDISGSEGHDKVRLPVRYRYRSPIFFEIYRGGRKKPMGYASLWLAYLVDMEEKEFDIPIWKTDRRLRLSQNHITEKNYKTVPDISIEEVGRLRFRARFSTGIDRDHRRFMDDSNSRETMESWEACFAAGERGEGVRVEVPEQTQKKHDESLTQGSNILKTADEKEKAKWLAKDGTDWSSAFGKGPASMTGQADDNQDKEGEDLDEVEYDDNYDGNTEDDDSGSSVDLGIKDGSNTAPGVDGGSEMIEGEEADEGTETGTLDDSTSGLSKRSSRNPVRAYRDYKERSRDLHRLNRGLMQWKPLRNMQFAKDGVKFAVHKVRKMGTLEGRKPDMETEL